MSDFCGETRYEYIHELFVISGTYYTGCLISEKRFHGLSVICGTNYTRCLPSVGRLWWSTNRLSVISGTYYTGCLISEKSLHGLSVICGTDYTGFLTSDIYGEVIYICRGLTSVRMIHGWLPLDIYRVMKCDVWYLWRDYPGVWQLRNNDLGVWYMGKRLHILSDNCQKNIDLSDANNVLQGGF